MSLISDPYKSFKDQALRIWDTKDFAERLAFSTFSWFQSILVTFMLLTFVHIFIWAGINDLFKLANFYSGNEVWYISFLQDVWKETAWIQLALLFFWTCPKITRFGLKTWKNWNDKEVGWFNSIETKIKLRFPSFKTSAQRSRERVDKPIEPTKLQKWIKNHPPVQRRLIRISFAAIAGISMFFVMGYMLNPDMIEWVLTGEKPPKEIPPEPTLEEQLANQPIPKQPDGRPPSTIYDIFIRQSDSVFP